MPIAHQWMRQRRSLHLPPCCQPRSYLIRRSSCECDLLRISQCLSVYLLVCLPPPPPPPPSLPPPLHLCKKCHMPRFLVRQRAKKQSLPVRLSVCVCMSVRSPVCVCVCARVSICASVYLCVCVVSLSPFSLSVGWLAAGLVTFLEQSGFTHLLSPSSAHRTARTVCTRPTSETTSKKSSGNTIQRFSLCFRIPESWRPADARHGEEMPA